MSGKSSASASRKRGIAVTEKNVPEMNAIGRYTALMTAEEPSAPRMSAVIATPSGANAAAPARSVNASAGRDDGNGASSTYLPP